jgi:hypothetical protein
MEVAYILRLSDDYIVEAHHRHRARASAWWLRAPIKIFCGVFLAALLGFGIWAGEFIVIAIPAFFLFLLLLGPRIDYFIIRRRWKRVPQFNEEMKVEMSGTQISSSSAKAAGTSAWSNYVKATQHRDGVMLYNAPWNYFWLPDSALVKGTSEQARELIRSAIPQYHVV